MIFSIALLFPLALVTEQQDAAPSVSVVARPPTDVRTPHYVGHRPPLHATPLVPLPIGSIEPRGWLRAQLRMQADGFHGHLGELSRFLEKDGNAWLTADGQGTHGWEEPVYWLKGFGACAYVLGDEAGIAEAKGWIEAILNSQKPDGWFGPDGDRGGAATRLRGREDLWPNMIALFCLQDWYELTGDERVPELMGRYFSYLAEVPDERFLNGYWPKLRGGDLLFSVHWLFDRVGGESLLDLAAKVHRNTARWEDGIIDWHNVNMAQGFGEPTTFWPQSGEQRHLEASYRNYDEIRHSYGQVPGGMFGGDENCRPGCTGPRQAVETCGMVEMMLSLETLAWITGDPLWFDRCEDVAFNSLPAATTADLRALRYLTAPNMVRSDAASKAPGLQNGGPMLLMTPHQHRCCQHDFGHGWPNFARHAWFATNDRGLAAMTYFENRVEATVADGARVAIEVTTHYPFDDRAEFTVRSPSPVRFPLYLRIPGWCEGAELAIDGEAVAVPAAAGRYLRIERTWRDGSTVTLRLPMAISLRRWTENRGTVSVDRGPLTYSLQIGEEYVRAGGTDPWPAWEILPTTAWNYGLVLPESDAAVAFEVVERIWPADDRPFTHAGTPLALRATGRRIPEWQLDPQGLCTEVQQGPVRTTEPDESITLIPMGAARLRIAAFPVIGEGPDAHVWEAPPEPAFAASASHCFASDTPLAVADGRAPTSSADHSIPRLTFWDHRGTTEWVQATFDAPREVSKVAVYWFDDTGRGACRIPASWRLLARLGDEWTPVTGASTFGVEIDRFNLTTFDPVRTDALRIEVVMRAGYSGGVLEWRVE